MRSWGVSISVLRRLRARPAFTLSGSFLLCVILLCLIGPRILAYFGIDPYTIDAESIYAPSSLAHPLGTDDLGRDVLARLLLGGRISLIVAFSSTIATVGIGFSVGLIAGYYGGFVDTLMMRSTELVGALPRLPLMVFLGAIDLEKVFPGSELMRGPSASILRLVAIIALLGWMNTARLARAGTLQLRGLDFVSAARAFGASDRRILFRHIAPGVLAPVLVAATLELGGIIVYESVLSFLGLGVSPPEPSWGAMLARGMTYLHSAPLLLVLPGLLTFLTVAAFNVAGDELREGIDPKRTTSCVGTV